MVEQVLDLDPIAAGKGHDGHEVAQSIPKFDPLFGRELVQHQRDHDFADRADLKQGVGGDRGAGIGVGMAEIQDRSLSGWRDEAQGHSGQVEIAAMSFAISADGIECGS